MTEPRLPYLKLEPTVFPTMQNFQAYVDNLALDPQLKELAKVRASQLNGCAYCHQMHGSAALTAGVASTKLQALPVWKDADVYFSASERAVLGLVDALTLISSGVPDTVIEGMRGHYSDKEIVHWIMLIISINAWNRLLIATGTKVSALPTRKLSI